MTGNSESIGTAYPTRVSEGADAASMSNEAYGADSADASSVPDAGPDSHHSHVHRTAEISSTEHHGESYTAIVDNSYTGHVGSRHHSDRTLMSSHRSSLSSDSSSSGTAAGRERSEVVVESAAESGAAAAESMSYGAARRNSRDRASYHSNLISRAVSGASAAAERYDSASEDVADGSSAESTSATSASTGVSSSERLIRIGMTVSELLIAEHREAHNIAY